MNEHFSLHFHMTSSHIEMQRSEIEMFALNNCTFPTSALHHNVL